MTAYLKIQQGYLHSLKSSKCANKTTLLTEHKRKQKKYSTAIINTVQCANHQTISAVKFVTSFQNINNQ